MSNKILVIGSTGKTGKRVFQKLQENNYDVVPASRNSEIPFDWHDPITWSKAIENCNTIYITFQPDLAVPKAKEIIASFVEIAKKQKVNKLVLLSGRGEIEAQVCEKIVINSGLKYTIIRASFFMQNFSENFWLDDILSGEFVIPILHTKEPFIDADDIAEVVVASLTNDNHNGKIYELTGPELLSFNDVIAKIAHKTNKQINFVQLEIDQYVQLLKSKEVPDDFIWLLHYLFTEVLDGRNEYLTADVELVLDKEPRTFENYVFTTLTTGVWTSQQT